MSSSPTERRLSAAVEVTMPQMGVSVAEGTIVLWRVAVGDEVAADETICEVSTDKIDTDVPAPVAGTVTEILAAVEETVPVGTVIARIAGATNPAHPADPADPTNPTSATNPADSADPTNPTDPAGRQRPRFVSPVVQRIAADHGIDLDTVAGSGRQGRVTKADVLAAHAGGIAAPAPEAPDPPLHSESPYRPDPPVPQTGDLSTAPGPTLSRMRRQIGEHMKRSQQTAATCTTWIEADMSAVERARVPSGHTALPYVAAATVAALGEHPALNATLDGETYTVHEAVHLGIAVSLGENGLIVPVIRDAQTLSIQGLADRIRDLARRARAGQLRPDEVHGGTFTITNPGQYGSIMATPVIHQPQVAILDLEAVLKRPVVVQGPNGADAITIAPMTILGLSWDHRALDGALSAQFLATVARRLALASPHG